MTRVAILNSRQSKTPVGNDLWVRATLSAVAHVASNGWTIVSSIGLNTWELVTWSAGRQSVPLVLLCPSDISESERSNILDQFSLDDHLVEWMPVGRGEGRSAAKNWWERRDSEIVSAADRLIPISIRAGGRLESLIESIPDGKVDNQFRVSYIPAPHHDRDAIELSRVNQRLGDWSDQWLIHWTRARHGPWPGEREAEFYADLVASGNVYCRSGIEALRRILWDKRIRASSWRIGAGAPMVAFTELSPIDSLKLMRWRPRWSRWSFEPYGIAIRREAAMAMGAKPVHYVDEADWKHIAESEKPFTHRRGKETDIWSVECEWRCAGDLDFSRVQSDQVRVLVRRSVEQVQIESKCPHPVFALELD